MRPRKSPGWQPGSTKEHTASLADQHARRGVPFRFQNHPKTQTARARRAFKHGAHGARLKAALGEREYLFTLTVRDLDPNISDHPDGLHDPAVVNALFEAAAEKFCGPFYMTLEVGRGDISGRGRLHPHVIAHRDDGPPHIRRESQRCKWVYDALNLYRYLNKHEPPTREAQISYTAALVRNPTGRAPKVRRPFLFPNRVAYAAELTARAEPLPPVLECGQCRGRCLCRRGPQCTNDLTPEPTLPPAAAGDMNAGPDSRAAAGEHVALATDRANTTPSPVAVPSQESAQRSNEGLETRLGNCGVSKVQPARAAPRQRPQLATADAQAPNASNLPQRPAQRVYEAFATRPRLDRAGRSDVGATRGDPGTPHRTARIFGETIDRTARRDLFNRAPRGDQSSQATAAPHPRTRGGPTPGPAP